MSERILISDLEGEPVHLRLMFKHENHVFCCYDQEALVVSPSRLQPSLVFIGEITLPADTYVSYNGETDVYEALISIERVAQS